MIFFVAPADQTWGIEEYLQQDGSALCHRLKTLTYDEIIAHRQVPLGTYIFGAIDQLIPTEREIAAQCCEELSSARPDTRLLNRPTEVLSRHELLETCFELKRNTFRVRRASEFYRCRHFPVFVRPDREHGGSLTPVLYNQRQLTQALTKTLLWGYRLRDLIIVEYCGTADASGIFREYCAFIVGDQIIPQVLVHNRNWITKWEGRLLDAEKAREQLEYVESHPHAEWLKETFALAKVGYGRIDYGLKDGLPQVWEVNTNPTITRRIGAPSALTDDQWRLVGPARAGFFRRFQVALEGIDSEADPNRMIRIDVSRRQLRQMEADKRLRLRLRARKTAIALAAYAPMWLFRRLRAK